MDYVLHREQIVQRPLEEVFDFFADAHNLEEITPAFLNFRIDAISTPAVTRGTLITYSLRLHGIRLRWVTEIDVWDPPHRFVDVQIKGPYRRWRHLHEFKAVPEGTLIVDEVCYSLPFGLIGRMSHGLVRRDIEKIFDYRNTAIAQRFRRSSAFPGH